MLLSVVALFVSAHMAEAAITLVENGQPRAEIVIAEQPSRTVRLAAQELQDDIKTITGAHLPIVTTPSSSAAHVYVGQSSSTDRLNISAAGLKDGAYRIAVGDNWLVLIGDDREFTPYEPWARNNSEIVSGVAQKKWEQIAGAPWGIPNVIIYKNRTTLPGDAGLSDNQRQTGIKLPRLEIWAEDERGSFNAVCGLMYQLGMRWYAPGPQGEVAPKVNTIALPTQDKIVRPDFPIRRFNVRFATHGEHVVRWAMRLGLRDPYGIEAAHGMSNMTDRKEILDAHPEWFALYGGKRHNQHEQGNNQLCYSNEELFQQTVRYVRAQFDQFNVEMASVMPPDGYTAICQCPMCAGKDTPQRGSRGLASDYVWEFVNSVAREVRKTHPQKKIINCAYGIYSLPPQNIAKLEPNVVVSIVGGRLPMFNKPTDQEEVRRLRESWLPKTDNPIVIFENYPLVDRGWYLPAFTAHALGSTINATKGYSQGEDIWLSMPPDFEKTYIGFNHFLVYFTQRMYWGGPQADIDALFREYVRLYYGPAESAMNAFFDYCEAHWQSMEKEKEKADHALTLFAQAKSRVEPASIYGERLAKIDEYLNGLRDKSAQLGRIRGPVPVLRLVGDARERPVIDGKLDDEAWAKAFPSATCRLRELETGRQPTFGTTVKSTWFANDLYFAIRCEERPGESPRNVATRKDDSAIWYGDVVEVLLETESHSYYQIAISPSGVVTDLDRGATKDKWFGWDSVAEVATHVADDHWTIEMRLPITADRNDPLNQVVGRHPNRSLPWHINICRQRVRDDGSELSAFSPTGAENFHNVMKFATFYDGNSFQFEHGPADDDFLEAMRVGGELARTGKRAEALKTYQTAAEGKVSSLQKSHALELAAGLARHLMLSALADQLVAKIPLESVRKSAQMQALLDMQKAPTLIEQFAQEKIESWPFWKRGDGFYLRGQAYAIAKQAAKAETDLAESLTWISDSRLRDEARLHLAHNRRLNLANDDGALEQYQAIIGTEKQLGSSTQFYAVYGAASILSKRGKHDEALATLRRVDSAKLNGFWNSQFRYWLAETLASAGRKAEARSEYERLSQDEQADTRLRKAAAEALNKLGN